MTTTTAHRLDKHGRHVLLVRGHHSSGKWSDTPGDLRANVRKTRANGRSFGSRTELTVAAMAAVVDPGRPAWEVFHPDRCEDLAWEWDDEVWQCLDPVLVKLDNGGLQREGGAKIPPSHLVGAKLQHRRTGGVLYGGTVHLQLPNNGPRAELQLEQMHTLRRHFRGVASRHPQWVRLLDGDLNIDQRTAKGRRYFEQQCLAGTGMTNLWNGAHLPPGGTHGRKLIDGGGCSDPDAWLRLLTDDDSSDHRPVELGVPMPWAAA